MVVPYEQPDPATLSSLRPATAFSMSMFREPRESSGTTALSGGFGAGPTDNTFHPKQQRAPYTHATNRRRESPLTRRCDFEPKAETFRFFKPPLPFQFLYSL
jgi:hypothetical protein